MTIYHVDRYHDLKDNVHYAVIPYDFVGTIHTHFSRNFLYTSWWSRFTNFFGWLKNARFSKEKAHILCDKLNQQNS